MRLERWNFPVPDLTSRERGWGLNHSPMANDLINDVYVIKPPETSKRTGPGELPGEHMERWGEWCWERVWELRALSPRLALRISPIWMVIYIL